MWDLDDEARRCAGALPHGVKAPPPCRFPIDVLGQDLDLPALGVDDFQVPGTVGDRGILGACQVS
jgi:hypothetical protein